MVTLANSVINGSVRAATAPLLKPDGLAKVVPVLGTEALFFYRMDDAEHERREAVGAARLDRMHPLEVLLNLPVGLPVPLASLEKQERRAVHALPCGAADRDRRTVTRRAVRPLHVDLAVVRATGWKRGLEEAGRFAPYCRRAILLTRRPAGISEALAEADFYGIGVFLISDEEVEMVLEPRDYRPLRHTAAAWSFVEEMYQRVR
ncbi:hypothetical protein [Streptomyces microflavus]|uniref:hypothetical protein n=1 Tax=Streptomyces microflavus TaxID=1919 RepID=UPI0036914290